MKIKVEYPVVTFKVSEVEIPDEYAEYLKNAAYPDDELHLNLSVIPAKIMNDIEKRIWRQASLWNYGDDYEILGWETNTEKESEE